jgi:hypothetical protein
MPTRPYFNVNCWAVSSFLGLLPVWVNRGRCSKNGDERTMLGGRPSKKGGSQSSSSHSLDMGIVSPLPQSSSVIARLSKAEPPFPLPRWATLLSRPTSKAAAGFQRNDVFVTPGCERGLLGCRLLNEPRAIEPNLKRSKLPLLVDITSTPGPTTNLESQAYRHPKAKSSALFMCLASKM